MKSICVLIPHFNDIEGLEKSLASISDLEPVDVVIVDDGSKIKPNLENLRNKYKQINNIYILNNKKNRGIEYVLNQGLQFIKERRYKYVARLDCRDICHPERFKIQKQLLEENPDIYLVGTWVEFVNKNGKRIFFFTPPTEHEEIKKKMFINNMFIHPSVMFRTQAIDIIGYYPTDRKNAEDYAYFFRFVRNFKTANIDKILLKCEVNPAGLSLSKRRLQIKSRIKVILDNFDLSFYAFYGLFRNLLLLFIPYKLVELLKRQK
ncbi:glycosyltransferase [Thermodesulfobacterium hydrogeniphilum]|uniref:glycosyltransferase n=1 Tax=Thermodesulfobacterium hydrogeniphilum TaxID=161156 RepID=UPI00056FEAEC|nr:glycosyltransferase [Thermodesulfobacterium hydrogeniphilum]